LQISSVHPAQQQAPTQEDNIMTFFYDLNKRLANLSQQQTLTEGAVAERATGDYSATKARAGKDIGKPGKNFSKIAADAGKRYGSKAAGERVAGAVLNKLRHPSEGMDEAIRIMAKPEGSQVTRGTAAYVPKNSIAGKTPQGQAHRDATAAMAKSARAAGGKLAIDKTTDTTGTTGPSTRDALAKGVTPYRSSVEEAEMEEGNDFTKARLDAIKANKPTFTVGGKTYKVTGDTSDEKMMEDFDDMIKDVKKRMGPRVGDVRRGAHHDIETTATGIRATRRHDDEADEQPTGEKRKAGRPKGADKGPERVTAKAYKHKGGRIKEEGITPGSTDADAGEYGYEGDMAKDQIHTIVRHAKALEKILSNREDLPEWVQSKLAKIEGMMAAVDDYMETQHERGAEMDQGIDLEEESTDTRDNRAERAGKRVTKDLEYDMKHKGKDDAKAERAGRKVTKDIEYDEKKKEKKVAETTASGSVATGGDAPKTTKGGVQIGKGIYDSLNREVENMIAESMSVNVSMTRDDNGSHKNITVTASDEDAEMLAQLLARAGLGGGMSHGHGHGEPCPECGSTDCGCDDVCPDCGQSPCACDHMMDEAYGDTTATENKPNWPTDTEYSDDAMQYSGGLNKPKASGMATIPVTDVQTDGEDKFGMIDRLREMAGITQQRLMPWERTMKEEAVSEAIPGQVAPALDAQIDPRATSQYAQKIIQSLDKYCGSGTFDSKYNDDGTVTIFKKRDQMWADDAYRQRGKNPNDPELKQMGVLTSENMNKAIDPYWDMFRSKRWLFGQPVMGQFTIGVTKAQQPAVEEGVVDTVKDAVKKGLEKLGHGSDEEMRKDLQKKMGVPQTGEKPKDDKKMQESLMQEFANFKI
jgi:hypothetical protein